ncbi:DUF3592 domain-containing protein [Chryseolinea soli]|uniref:DUF3592 domain-containing protein n=1 Tax=Chryseolinea soli TaxID=2321403 RepID=UPI0013579AC3|nr:DUF3592 domain-containing protein [Chryseolinea soli]
MDFELFIVILSSVLLIVGAKLWQDGNHLVKNGKTATAVVFRNNFKTYLEGGSGLYYPVVRFLTDKQEWITEELSVGYNPKKREGAKLRVIYDPENPTEVEIHSILQLRILPLLFIVAGVAGMGLSSLEYLGITDIVK